MNTSTRIVSCRRCIVAAWRCRRCNARCCEHHRELPYIVNDWLTCLCPTCYLQPDRGTRC